MMQAYLTRNETHFHGSTPTQETHRNDDLRLSVPDVVVSLVAPSSLPPRLFTLSYDQFIPLSTDSITPTCKFTLVHRPVPQH
jgi:hypothetical protein